MPKSCDGHKCDRPADRKVIHALDGAEEYWCLGCIPNFDRAKVSPL